MMSTPACWTSQSKAEPDGRGGGLEHAAGGLGELGAGAVAGDERRAGGWSCTLLRSIGRQTVFASQISAAASAGYRLDSAKGYRARPGAIRPGRASLRRARRARARGRRGSTTSTRRLAYDEQPGSARAQHQAQQRRRGRARRTRATSPDAGWCSDGEPNADRRRRATTSSSGSGHRRAGDRCGRGRFDGLGHGLVPGRCSGGSSPDRTATARSA